MISITSASKQLFHCICMRHTFRALSMGMSLHLTDTHRDLSWSPGDQQADTYCTDPRSCTSTLLIPLSCSLSLCPLAVSRASSAGWTAAQQGDQNGAAVKSVADGKISERSVCLCKEKNQDANRCCFLLFYSLFYCVMQNSAKCEK